VGREALFLPSPRWGEGGKGFPMSRLSGAQRLMPSLLDRLIDPESAGTDAGHGYSVQQMIDVVRRDLEELLNTRQTHSGIPKEFTEVLSSLVAYGLPDLTSTNAVSDEDRAEIGKVIEASIARFEPRLRDIRATLVPSNHEQELSVRFQIHAKLAVDPAPEIGFETVLELTTGQATIRASQE